jgi:hypothetical protein
MVGRHCHNDYDDMADPNVTSRRLMLWHCHSNLWMSSGGACRFPQSLAKKPN